MKKIIGREAEQEVLAAISKSNKAALLAVFGRRRVGKTYLIRNYFSPEILVELGGIHNVSLELQLQNFATVMSKKMGVEIATPKNWLSAFGVLQQFLEQQLKKGPVVLFLDEFPWFATPRSSFLPVFENFWNSWASRQEKLVVVLCGSAASWMIRNVINNKGGLHNRVTHKMRLLPFNLHETEAFLKSKNMVLDRYQLLQLYMVMGGIPQYLDEIKKGESATQVIDRVCFTKDGFLAEEFKRLFTSLFDNAAVHTAIVRALAAKGKGLTRNELIEICKLKTGGWLTEIFDELTESGFISSYIPFGKAAKDGIYRLTDEYIAFYLKFIEGTRIRGKGAWAKYSMTPSWRSWSGFAFENICLKQEDQLKKALGIGAVYTEFSVWRHAPKTGVGAQIDLLIDRQDQSINICEMKFSVGPYQITKADAKELENKLQVFRAATGTRKTVFLTMVTSFGVANVENYAGLVQNEVTMDALFSA